MQGMCVGRGVPLCDGMRLCEITVQTQQWLPPCKHQLLLELQEGQAFEKAQPHDAEQCDSGSYIALEEAHIGVAGDPTGCTCGVFCGAHPAD